MRRPADPSAWRKFRKPRRLTAEDRARSPAWCLGLPVRLIAEWGCCSLKHASLLKGGVRAPSPQLVRLVCLYRGERALVGPFSRFICRGNKLITPEGFEFSEAELRGYRSMLDWAHSCAQQVGRVDEYYRRLEACRELA